MPYSLDYWWQHYHVEIFIKTEDTLGNRAKLILLYIVDHLVCVIASPSRIVSLSDMHGRITRYIYCNHGESDSMINIMIVAQR
jgi:hypothetical protein